MTIKFHSTLFCLLFTSLSLTACTAVTHVAQYVKYGCTKPVKGEYEEKGCYINDIARVKQQGKYGFVNKEEQVVIPLIYDEIDEFKAKYAKAKKNKQWGMVDRENKTIIPFKYDSLDYFYSGIARVSKHAKYGFVNTLGEVVIPLKYNQAKILNSDGIRVKLNNSFGIINFENKIIIPINYSFIDDFHDEFAKVEQNGKYGLINSQWQFVVPIKYDELYYFSDGLAKVAINGKYGYINKQGTTAIDLQYDNAQTFNNDLAIVGIDDNYGVINTQGTPVLAVIHDSINNVESNSNFLVVKKATKYGLFDKKKRRLILPIRYKYIDTKITKKSFTKYDLEPISEPISSVSTSANNEKNAKTKEKIDTTKYRERKLINGQWFMCDMGVFPECIKDTTSSHFQVKVNLNQPISNEAIFDGIMIPADKKSDSKNNTIQRYKLKESRYYKDFLLIQDESGKDGTFNVDTGEINYNSL